MFSSPVKQLVTRIPAKTYVVLTLLLLLLCQASFAKVKVLVSPAEKVVAVGATFTIEVRLESGTQPIDAANIFLAFDPALVQVVSATAGTSLGVPLSPISFDNTAGIISYAYGTFSNFPTGNFTLFSAQLRATASGNSSLSFVSRNGIATDLTFSSSSVLGQQVNGQVRAGGVTGISPCIGCQDKEMLAYPNPTTGRLQLYISDSGTAAGKIKISKADGTLLKTLPLVLKDRHSTELDLTGQATGLYLIEVQTDRTKTLQRVVKY